MWDFPAIPYATSTNRVISQASITSGTKDLTILDQGHSRRTILDGLWSSRGSWTLDITGITSSTAATVHDNATATATNASMTVKQYDTTLRASTFLHVVNSHVNIEMRNCVDEGLCNFLVVDASTYDGVIQLTNCFPQSMPLVIGLTASKPSTEQPRRGNSKPLDRLFLWLRN